jgi:hypothetical protein
VQHRNADDLARDTVFMIYTIAKLLADTCHNWRRGGTGYSGNERAI